MLLATSITTSRPIQRPHRAARSGHSLRAPRVARQPVVAFLSESKEKPNISVRFTLQCKVPYGQDFAVIGSAPQLGSWDLGRAARMSWSEGDSWHADVELPAGAVVEWKFVRKIPNCPAVWEGCQNRTLSVDAAAADLTCTWAAPLATSIQPSLATRQLAEMISGSAGEGDELTDEDAPAPPFRPSATLSQIADVVKQSLWGNSEPQAAKQDAKQAAKPAPAAATAESAAPAAPAPAPASSSQTVFYTAEMLAAPVAEALAQPKAPTSGSAAAAAAAKHAAAGASSSPPSKAVTISAEAEAAVGSIIDGAGPTRTGVPAPAGGASRTSSGPKPAGPGGDEAGREAVKTVASTAVAVAQPLQAGSLQTIGRMAGTVVLGVGAAAMLTAFAIDIADVAMLGAVAAGSMAALSTPASTSGSTKKAVRGGKAEAGAVEEVEVEIVDVTAETVAQVQPAKKISQKASAPGVILAAGVLSAIDAGRKILASNDEDDSGKGRK